LAKCGQGHEEHHLLTTKPNSMKSKQFNLLIGCLAFLMLGCIKEDHSLIQTHQGYEHQVLSKAGNQVSAGATQIAGIGYFDELGDCDHVSQGADFALLLTGDLEGCLYVFVDEHECSPSGTYRENGRENFIGTYDGESGSFWTSYKFEAKYEGCTDGFFVGAEIFGRCQHPIENGTGTGVFEGVKGRLDFKDNVETGELPYRGHLRY
jgi:hypothetical protein